jgi:RNA polymerase subunit RPABC4/transcription elongation factor Spt4
MEITCTRCHQAIQTDDCYCPACGLPQLLYTSEGLPGQAQPEQWNEAVRDASEVAWKPALRAAMTLAVPAGLLCSLLSPVGIFGLFLMAMAAYWAVVLYVRSQRAAWITVGAGARIGLVTGVVGSWTAAATTGVTLFAMRFLFHNGKFIDDFWLDFVNQQMAQQWATMGVDAPTIVLLKAWLLSPEGRAGFMMGGVLFLMGGLLLFAVGGGALGAKLLARTRRPEV